MIQSDETSWWEANKSGRVTKPRARITCAECGQVAYDARGWRGVRVDLPDEGDEPALAFYCPDCAAREFGGLTRS